MRIRAASETGSTYLMRFRGLSCGDDVKIIARINDPPGTWDHSASLASFR